MGVMNCYRKGCENIMCDRYSPNYGYICNECFDEMTEDENFVNIEEFMDSEKGYKNSTDNSYENLNEIFEKRD